MGSVSLFGFLLVIIGIALILLLLHFLPETQSLDPLFLLSIAIGSLVSLSAGIFILSKN
jgi:hypothetical protein